MEFTIETSSDKIKKSFYKALETIKIRGQYELTPEDLNHIIGVVVGEAIEEGRKTVEELVVNVLHPLIRKELINSVAYYGNRVQKALNTPSEPPIDLGD